MDHSQAIAALGALAQDTRLRVFRLLVEAGQEGLPATEIADRLEVRQNLMSSHLRVLANARLTTIRREGRQIFHAADFSVIEGLLTFLLSDCCRGEPEKCATLLRSVLAEPCAGPTALNQ